MPKILDPWLDYLLIQSVLIHAIIFLGPNMMALHKPQMCVRNVLGQMALFQVKMSK